MALLAELDAASEAFRQAADLLSDNRRWREANLACRSWGQMLRHTGRSKEALDVLEHASELALRAAPAEQRH